MNTQDIENGGDSGTAIEAETHAINKPAIKRIPRAAVRSKSPGTGKRGAPTSKKDRLIALLSKPSGARISVIVERLGWQAHTVRAALSGLRKQGIEVMTSKSPKTGESVYAIVAREDCDSKQAGQGPEA